MPRTFVQAAAFLLGFWFALWLAPLEIRASPETDALGAVERHLHAEVNRVRTARHLIALDRRVDLDTVARAHSEDMARRQYIAHQSPEGHDAVYRLEAHRIDGFSLAAENIGQTNRANPVDEIVSAWVASPLHRGNLFAPPFNATGIGIARASDGALIVTQLYLTYPIDSGIP